MVKKLAIDWDEGELRLVAAQCSGRNVKVTDAAVVPIEASGVVETLKSVIAARGLENTETLVAIGRGKAELRELQLPTVPDDELPEMVRFQAIRSFASAGESATVDYLVTKRNDEGIEMIAAAVAPDSLNEIRETCEAAGLTTKRIALRPLSAAALYLINNTSSSGQDTVLIDLLSDDAEIVVARRGKVIFVRTVRMPTGERARGRALAGELKRSLVACGSSGSLDRVVLWGRESVHAADTQMLADASGSEVEVLDPFALVELDRKAKEDLPEHVGRLAPLVGLLAADESDGDRLIDFLNPRKKEEEKPNTYRQVAMYGVPAAAALLLGFLVYGQLKDLDGQIEELKSANAGMKSDVDAALESVGRTEKIDQFLDGDVNWLREIERLATSMPASDRLIVRQISANSDSRGGGGTLKVEGGVTSPDVIDEFETALRDDNHRVTGDGASEQRTQDAYRWGFTESITITADSIRNSRYEAISELLAAEKTAPAESPPAESPPAETPPDESPPDETPPDETPPDESSSSTGEPVEAEEAGDAPQEPDNGEEQEKTDDADLVVEVRSEVKS